MAFTKRTRATALDRDPLDPEKLDKLMLFLKDRLAPGDFSKFTDLIDDLQDDAETANPSLEMATDALPIEIRRAARREGRNVRLGLAGQTSLAQDSARTKSFAERYPDVARIKTDMSWGGQPAERPSTPRVAMDSRRVESFNERFGTARIRNAD